MAVTASVVAATAAVGSAVMQTQATKATNRAQERAARIQQRQAELETRRRSRRAIAGQRIARAEMIQATETMGARGSSSLAGATGSLITQTASNIGAAQSSLAADIGINRSLMRGARQAAKYNTYAGAFDVVGSIAGSAGFQNYAQTQFGGTTTSRLPGTKQLNQHKFGQTITW